MLPKAALGKAWTWNQLGEDEITTPVHLGLCRPLLLKEVKAAIICKKKKKFSYLVPVWSRAGKLLLLPLALQGFGELPSLCFSPGVHNVLSPTRAYNQCKEQLKSQTGHFLPTLQPFLLAWQGKPGILASHWAAQEQAASPLSLNQSAIIKFFIKAAPNPQFSLCHIF